MARDGKWPEPRVVVSGLGFPEGPVYLGNGVVACTEIRGQCVARVDGSEVKKFGPTGGGANGATLGAGGEIWVANNGGLSLGWQGYWFAEPFVEGRIQRIDPDGTITDVSGDLPGELPHRPNDLCFGPDGLLYFTDPRNWEDLGNLKMGRIWRMDPMSGAAEALAEVPSFCNGIAFGPDPSRLYVAQTMAMKIMEIEWSGGKLGAQREWAALPEGFPDGFCFSSEGDAYVCGATANVLQVFDAEGCVMYTINFPEHSDPTNCCIGDGDLYVTCSGTGELLAFDLGLEPLPLFPFRT